MLVAGPEGLFCKPKTSLCVTQGTDTLVSKTLISGVRIALCGRLSGGKGNGCVKASAKPSVGGMPFACGTIPSPGHVLACPIALKLAVIVCNRDISICIISTVHRK